MAADNPVRFEGSQPVLRVESMAASLHFYVNQLGFKNADWGDENFTSVNRDAAGIYLCRGNQGRGGAWVWIGVEDAERLHGEFKARGVSIRMPPTNYPWLMSFMWKTLTATCCALDQSQSKTKRSRGSSAALLESGSISQWPHLSGCCQ